MGGMLTTPSIQEQYRTTYRIAECEAKMLCMVYANDRDHIVQMMNGMVERYAKLGILLKQDRERLTVTLPNDSVIMYIVSR